jgi:23S rRNA (guanosine2251-2'-O)-methyltransferase
MQHTLFGRKVLLENLNNPQVAHVDLAKNNHDLIAKLKAHHIHFQIRDDAFFKQFPSKLIHQGIMIVMKDTNLVNNLDDLMINLHNKAKSIIVIIDSIQDAQNFGSILRTCEAFGVDAVIYKKDQQVQLNDFVSKSSMGATQYLNLIRVSNLLNVINTLKVNKY